MAKIPAVDWLPCCCPSAGLPTRPVIFLTFYGINPRLLQTDQAGICCWHPRSLADILNDSQQMYVPRREVEARSCSPWDPGDCSWPFGFHNGRQKPRIPLHQDHTQWGRGKFQKEHRLLLNEECGSTVSKTGHMCANQSLFIQVNSVRPMWRKRISPFLPVHHTHTASRMQADTVKPSGYSTDCLPDTQVSKGTKDGSREKERRVRPWRRTTGQGKEKRGWSHKSLAWSQHHTGPQHRLRGHVGVQWGGVCGKMKVWGESLRARLGVGSKSLNVL